jgi:hypothetical protein
VITELTEFSDYEQIYVADLECDIDVLPDRWGAPDNPLSDHLALAENGVSVGTGVNGHLHITVEVLDSPPNGGDGDAAQVVECSVRVASGVLLFSCCTYGPGDGERVAVPPGWLRLRIALTRSPFEGNMVQPDDPAGQQRMRLRCWPAPPSPPELVKGFDPAATPD